MTEKMSPSPQIQYPPSLSQAQQDFIISQIKDWSILNGLAVRPAASFVPRELDPSRSLAVTAPVTLFPSLFPRKCFAEARSIQEAYDQLYAAIAADEEWLGGIVEELVDVDDFIKSLWDIHLAVKVEGYVQDLALGIFRSDYMIHQEPSNENSSPELRQVEFNTIASSFGGLAAKVSALHRHLREIDAYPASHGIIREDSLPSNPSIESIAKAMELSHKAYGPSKSSHPLPLCVLFVVQDAENNVFDQLAISSSLSSKFSVISFRLPFSKVQVLTKIPSENKSRPLVYTPPHGPSTAYEVTLLYFRAGYSPSEYSEPEAWRSRLHLERSAAIKCPSILTHLAGSKKIQQILATPSSPYLERFLQHTPYNHFVERIRATFAAIYPLDHSTIGQQAIRFARDPDEAVKYVMKPQREGGGNNIYGVKIPPFLEALGNDERLYKSHILMELIQPPSIKNAIFRNGEMRGGEVIGELGIFGVCLWKNNLSGKQGCDLLENYEGGFLLRTKGRESEEGGVAAGFGAIDSVMLVDEHQ